MSKKEFKTWLIENDNKTENSAYNYSIAIPKISNHYSQQTDSDINLEEMDTKELEEICEHYKQGGKYADFGENSKGINRNALIALTRYKTFLNSEYPNNLYALKSKFLEVWSEERVKNMTLKEYTNLDRDSSFCYWLERTTTNLGSIKGGSSFKFGVFKRGEKGEISNARGKQSDGEYSWYSKYGDSKEEAFDSVKKHITKVITYSKENNLEGIDEIDLGDAYKWKIAFLYNDFNILNIFKYDALKLLSLDNSYPETKNESSSRYQSFLMNLKGEKEDYFLFSHKLWNRYETLKKNTQPQAIEQKRRFITYLHSKSLDIEIAEDLESLSDDVIGKGYYDLSIYECLTYYGTYQFRVQNSISNYWEDLYEHYERFIINQIKENTGVDVTLHYALVIANDDIELQDFIKKGYWSKKGKNVYSHYVSRFKKESKLAIYRYKNNDERYIYAVGTITEDFEDASNIKVDWNIPKEPFTVKSYSDTGTLHFYEIEPERFDYKFDEIKEIFYNTELMNQNKPPLNQILYGPPGTGKTYRIISDYISSQTSVKQDINGSKIYVDQKKPFWHLAPGESAYLWDDLKVQNYLGYEWCDIGLGNLKDLKKGEVDNYDMKSRFSRVREGDYFCIISGKKFYGIAKAKHSYDFEKSKNSNFDFQTIEVEWIKQFDKPELLNTHSTQSFSGTKGGKRWKSIINSLENQDIYFNSKKGKQVEKIRNNHAMVSFHQSFSYEDFIEGIKPDLDTNKEENSQDDLSYIIQDGIFKIACDKAANIAGYEDLSSCLDDSKENRKNTFLKAPPFYLLIDEINRGNISSIFGELITLLEDDKRLGRDQELILDLPYSKKVFGIPSNLFVIGTMNTADRSVEALDSALRRRFSFTEVIPNPNLLKDINAKKGIIEGIDLIKLLDTLNNRIELLLDKDHKVGHSYFINVLNLDDLTQVFKNKVIPLLEEYFYGDFGKIGLILGKAFIKTNDTKVKLAVFDHEDSESLAEKKIYSFKDISEWDAKSFQSIYDESIQINEYA